MTNAVEVSTSGTADCLVRKSRGSRTSRQTMRGLLRHQFDQGAHRSWCRVSLRLFHIFIFCWTSFMKIAIIDLLFLDKIYRLAPLRRLICLDDYQLNYSGNLSGRNITTIKRTYLSIFNTFNARPKFTEEKRLGPPRSALMAVKVGKKCPQLSFECRNYFLMSRNFFSMCRNFFSSRRNFWQGPSVSAGSVQTGPSAPAATCTCNHCNGHPSIQ